jgi:hypothetical protein
MPKKLSKYKKDKDPYHPDDYTISIDGNYFINMKLPWYRKFWLAIDAIVFAVIYLLVGFSLSVFLNDYTVRELDRDAKPPKARVGAEIIAQAITSVFFIYLVIQILPRILPNIYPMPPKEHYFFRQFVCNILLPFSIMAAEYKLVSKIRYVFGADFDPLDDLVEKYSKCPSFNPCTV